MSKKIRYSLIVLMAVIISMLSLSVSASAATKTFNCTVKNTAMTYTGSALKPAVEVKVGTRKIASTYYTVSYSNNINPGVATVKVTGKGTYSGYTGTVKFRVVPKPTNINTVTPGFNTVKFTWNKVTNATGYVLRISTDPNFATYTKQSTVSNSNTTSFTMTNVTPGKYYAAISAYINAKDTTLTGNYGFSAWKKYGNSNNPTAFSVKPKTGLYEENGNTYYYKNGTLMTGRQTVNGKNYWFLSLRNSDGRMLKNDFAIWKNNSYYYGADGVLVVNKKNYNIKGTLYNIDSTGIAVAIYSTKVTFNGNGATGNQTVTYKTGVANQTFKDALSRTGFVFVGWSTDKNSQNPEYKAKNGVGDDWIKRNNGKTITVYAIWKEKAAGDASDNAKRAYTRGTGFEIQYCLGPSSYQIANSIKKDNYGKITSDVVNKIVNAGFTIAPMRTGNAGEGNESWWYYEKLQPAVTALNAYNLKTYISAGITSSDIPFSLGATDHAMSVFKNQEDVKEVFKVISTNKNVLGIDLADEPSVPKMRGTLLNEKNERVFANGGYCHVAQKLAETTGKDVYINLFPSYAGEALFGAGNSGSFKDYLNVYLDLFPEAKVLSIDHYPSLNSSDYMSSRRSKYYDDLIQLLEACKTRGNRVIPMNIVCLTNWHIDKEKKSHIAYQVNTNLAFGMKRLSYFTYLHSKEKDNTWKGWLVGDNGGTTTQYEYVKQINQWAFNIGELLYSKYPSSIHNFTNGSGKRIYGSGTYTGILGNASCRSNGLITVFNDNKTVMLVNGSADTETTFTIPNLSKLKYYNPCTGNFVNANSNKTVKDTGNSTLFSINGKTVTLPAGAAVILSLS